MGSPILVDEVREQETGASEPQQISSLGGALGRERSLSAL